ncbi:MAG: translation initiation factor IF-3 [Sedimentisphaerales bacterium]
MIIKVKGLRINGGIRAEKVRLVDAENNQVGIVERLFAQEKAREANLDLVEVSPTSDPPVCRIMDYGKWVYEQKRKVREARKKTHHAGSLKEVRLRPETDAHDIEIKVKHAREFIEKGHKVQFTLIFRGRQMLHKDKGAEVLAKIVESLSDLAKVDRSNEMMGKRMTLVVAPK